MQIGELFDESYVYTTEALSGKWMRWLLLIVSSIIFPLIIGYVMEIFRGAKPAPKLENWGKLFIDGIMTLIIGLIYSIPIIIVTAFTFGGAIFAMSLQSPAAVVAGMGGFLGGMLIIFILSILIGLIATIGLIRFARTDSFGEAFNFGAILEIIGRIGWMDYIIAIVILYVAAIVVITILNMIPFIGQILFWIAIPAVLIFSARYLTRIYESA